MTEHKSSQYLHRQTLIFTLTRLVLRTRICTLPIIIIYDNEKYEV